MNKRQLPAASPAAAAAIALLVALAAPSVLGETYRKIGATQISRAFSGMEFTDDVHLAFIFGRSGRLDTVSMGARGTGAWRLKRDLLCLALPREVERCYEVWQAGTSVQLREPGLDLSVPLEGFLQKPAVRN